VPPEQLLSALLLQVLYGVRSERQLMEQLDYNLVYRWFVNLSPDDPVWNPTTFTKNRERLQNGEVFQKFMGRLLNHPQVVPGQPLIAKVDVARLDLGPDPFKAFDQAVAQRGLRHAGIVLLIGRHPEEDPAIRSSHVASRLRPNKILSKLGGRVRQHV
jgi:hypothetical protein